MQHTYETTGCEMSKIIDYIFQFYFVKCYFINKWRKNNLLLVGKYAHFLHVTLLENEFEYQRVRVYTDSPTQKHMCENEVDIPI